MTQLSSHTTPTGFISPSIYTQLLAAQNEFPTIDKDSVNPHLRNKYASLPSILNTVLPVLRKHGVLLTSNMSHDASDILQINLVHAETGSTISSDIRLLNTTDMQKWGGSVTYATRYGLLSLLGIAADLDDDGNIACEPPKQTKHTPIDVTPAVKEKPKLETTMTNSDRMQLTHDLHGLWSLKEGVIRAVESDKSNKAINMFKTDFVGVNDATLIGLRKWISEL